MAFDERAHARSSELWTSTHKGLGLAVAAGTVAGGAGWLLLRR